MSKNNPTEHAFVPYTDKPKCLKCSNADPEQMKIKFQKYYTHKALGIHIERNNLLVECQVCRFNWVMDCADSSEETE